MSLLSTNPFPRSARWLSHGWLKMATPEGNVVEQKTISSFSPHWLQLWAGKCKYKKLGVVKLFLTIWDMEP